MVLCLYLLIFGIPGFSQYNDNFLITGKVTGIGDEVIYLLGDNSGKIIDSTKILDGKFILSGILSEPFKCTIISKSLKEAIPIFLENAEYDIIINNDLFSYNVIGGKLHQDYMEYVNIILGYYDGLNIIRKILSKSDLWNKSDSSEYVSAELKKGIAFLEDQIIRKSEVFIKKNKDSYIAPRIISNILLINKIYIDKVKEYYDMMNPKIKTSSEGQDLSKRIKNLSYGFSGNKIESFRLTDENKNDFIFNKPDKNNYVLLNFWATWCGPCLQEFPTLKRIYNRYKSQGFEIINISIDKDKSIWQKNLNYLKLPGIQLIDYIHVDSSLAKKFKINSIPANFLIDENMKIVAFDLQMQELDEYLNEKYKSQ